MATTTKILATATRYGNFGDASYNRSGYLYVGKNDNNNIYSARVTFPSIRTIASIGDANIVITKVTFVARRDSGYKASTITVGSSADGSWGAVRDGTTSLDIPAKAASYSFDITNCSEAILNYSSSWYIHLTGTGSEVRFNGVGDDGFEPYINVTWEYAASTISTITDSTTLGTTANFIITPEEDYYSYNLSYEFGSQSGTITTGTTDTTYSWTPPLEFANEIPNSSNGEAKITMHVFNSEGTQIRTEILFVTLNVPESLKVEIIPATYTYGVNGSPSDVFLAGKTSISIIPTLSINNSYGATIRSFIAEINNEETIQTLTWDSFNLEEEAVNPQGYYTSALQTTSVFQNAGSVSITFTTIDSRGFDNTVTKTYTVHPYSIPTIENFVVERYEAIYNGETGEVSEYIPSDVGENVWVTLQANCSPITVNGTSCNNLTWNITAVNSDGSTTTYTGGGDTTSINYNADRGLINIIVPASVAVNYTLQVYDTMGYTTYQYDSITPGRANFALAASKYGASFGCLPKGTEERPMLESAYPIYAYGGIVGVNTYSTNEVKTGGTWIDGKPIYVQTFTGNAGTNKTNKAIGNIPDIDTIIDMRGTAVIADYNIIECAPSYRASGNSELWCGVYFGTSSKNVTVASSYSEGAFFRVTVYYTKTTD